MKHPILSEGQIIYYVHWLKYPTIHEARIKKVTKSDVIFDIDLDICKHYSGGCFFEKGYALNRKFYPTFEQAQAAVKIAMDDLINESLEAHNKLVMRACKTNQKPAKKLKSK